MRAFRQHALLNCVPPEIARQEFTEIVRDGAFRWAAGIVLILLVAALVMGWRRFREVQKQQQAAQVLDRKVWLAQGERNPFSAAHFGRYAFKPSPPLSFVDSGINAYTGVAIWMEAHYQNSARFRPIEDATTSGRFGELTAAIVLQLLVPLLVILLAFWIVGSLIVPRVAADVSEGALKKGQARCHPG